MEVKPSEPVSHHEQQCLTLKGKAFFWRLCNSQTRSNSCSNPFQNPLQSLSDDVYKGAGLRLLER
jgi:hypothetical protein